MRSKASWGYDQAFMAACEQELTVSPEQVLRCPTYVLVERDQVRGFYLLERTDSAVVELGHLFIEPTAIGRGYGTSLMAHAIATAAAAGYRSMLIQADSNAAGFYRRFGVVVIGTRPSDSIPRRDLPLLELRFPVLKQLR